VGNLVGPLLLIPSAICSVIPMLTLLGLVWWMDRYQREPVWLFVLTFLWGGIGGVLFAVAGSVALELPLLWLGMDPAMADAVGAIVVAPLAEEPAKAAFLLVVMWNRGFDNMTDGFVYGAAAGLGFGMTENFTYFASVGMTGSAFGWAQTVVIRTVYSAVMHATATSIVGACLGFARFRGWPMILLALGLGFPLAMTMHGLWNGILVLDQAQGSQGPLAWLDFAFLPIEVFTVFVVFQIALWDESGTIRRELEDEARNGLIPADHPGILASWWRRRGRDFVPKGVEHHQYVRSVTALALRKSQARRADPSDEFYRDEVARLRRSIQLLIARGRKA
jgi:protease PrsW